MRWSARRMLAQQAKSFGVYETALRLQATGADVIHLGVGRPSDDTPLHIKEAAKAALDAGCVHYGDLQGTGTLRAALAQRYREERNMPVTQECVLITVGVTQASFAACMAMLDPGDEVIVLEPYYPQHNGKIMLAGGVVVPVPLVRVEGSFRLNIDALESAVTTATRMIVLINPANPTGTVFARRELETLVEFAVKHDLLVLSDEVYEYIVFDGHSHISIASLPGMWERTITVSAFTKAYCMDGWRVGYAVAPAEIIRQLKLVTMNDTTHPCVFAQEGALAAVVGPPAVRDTIVAGDRRRRDLVVTRLNAMSGFRCPTPEGTIYAFPDVSAFGLPSTQLAARILERVHVAVEAGTFYGSSGEGHIRLCVASEPYDRLEEAMERLDRFVREHAT